VSHRANTIKPKTTHARILTYYITIIIIIGVFAKVTISVRNAAENKLTVNKTERWGSLSHHSSCSSSAEVGSHSTVQPGGRVVGQVIPATISSREPVKIMPQARLSILILS
jgi:hypothetical protein